MILVANFLQDQEMRWLLLPFAFALGLAGCTKKSSFERVQVSEATYQKVADVQNAPAILAQIENLLAKREGTTAKEADYFYVLEITSNQGRTFWHYNPNGTGVEIREGKDFAFFKIKDEQAFNKLIGVGKNP